ncbi:Zn-dependent proteases [Actinomyces bovis]|uniref:Zn-dependent proteases n=1 Tax=Actinomyces bovis TaxID=1658 RepID=A0ABY1VJY2_9ACTO|nr:site-2 protease family protein [Actinomyces bovis]SPT52406.1 Zn-dependent proteases [Actinomyces bovis]VEG54020.1 Zn-dependent proteases [Actinomyces israelii]
MTSPTRPAGSQPWTLLRIGGAPVIIDPTSLLLGLLIAGSWYPAVSNLFRSQITVLAVVGAAALGVLLSVFLHELAHGMTGTILGRKPIRYELMLLGGRTSFGPASNWAPWKDVLTSVIGPFTNAALWMLTSWLSHQPILPLPMAVTLWAISWVNLALAVFNILPGLPLDGGQAVASLVHQITGRRETGQRIAAWGGLLIVAGMAWYWIIRPLVVYRVQPSAFNLMLVLMVAWTIASTSWKVLQLGQGNRAAARLDLRKLSRPVKPVTADTALATVRAELAHGTSAVLVVDGTELLGIIDAVGLVEAGLSRPTPGETATAGQVCQVLPAAAVSTDLDGVAGGEALKRARTVSRWLILLDRGQVLGAVPTGAR